MSTDIPSRRRIAMLHSIGYTFPIWGEMPMIDA